MLQVHLPDLRFHHRLQRLPLLAALFLAICVEVSRAGALQLNRCSVDCSSHGSCRAGLCTCAAGWSGQDCSYFLVDSGSEDEDPLDEDDCVDSCSAHGACSGGTCHCDEGWGGLSCNVGTAKCPSNCFSHGSCNNGACDCSHGWFGRLCDNHLQEASSPPEQSRVGNERVREDGKVHTKPMTNRLQDLEKELQDVQKKSNVLKTNYARPEASSRAAPMLDTSPASVAFLSAKQPDLHAGLDVVRHATHAAGLAAERLRQIAKDELAKSAQRRVETAIFDAHKHVRDIPGYQDLEPPGLPPAPTPAPVRMRPLISTKAIQGFHATASPDLEHEDTEDSATTVEEPLFKVEAEVSQGVSTAGSQGTLKMPMLTATVLKCEGNCGGHGSCVTQGAGTACKCSAGWVGMLCDMQRCENDCNSRGVCIQGACLCGKGYAGSSCENTRCPDDCSGVGFCFAGRCRCKTGYEGANCAKVKPAGLSVSLKMHALALVDAPPPIDTQFEGMTLRAIPSKACPDNCNGRGVCNDGKCTCNVGYSGTTCNFCPNECSHNGHCIEGACLCFAGFLGTDCSTVGCCSGHGNCDNPGSCVCETGWDGNDCSMKLMCPDPGCSGHGTCSSGTCRCAPGFSGPSCAIEDGACVPPCGPSGACNPISRKCECAGGSVGLACSEAVQSCPKNCNNRGLCMNGKCMCGSGWMGNDCSQRYFKPGQKMPSADTSAGAFTAADAGSAGVSGEALPSSIGLDGAGEANDGTESLSDGASVRTAANRDEVDSDGSPHDDGKALVMAKASDGKVCGEGGLCSGHGTCNTALAQCECASMFFGDVCEMQHCPGFQGGEECSGHGLCQMGQCHCTLGWGMAPSTLLAALKPQACMDNICPEDCGRNGQCIDGACVCQQGWQGPNCKDPQCPNDCAGHGQCVFQTINSPGQCTCDYGWGGAGCQRIAMYTQLKKCPNDCSGQGLCMDGMCACNVGFKGPDCNDILCAAGMTGPKCDKPRCPSDCHGRGLCMNGTCACWASFAGKDCKLPIACQEPCSALCESEGQEEKCNSCIGMCESSAARTNPGLGGSELGSHNPFEDLQSSF